VARTRVWRVFMVPLERQLVTGIMIEMDLDPYYRTRTLQH
jgi:hypothetical protein